VITVVLVGLDGSGKTTIGRALVDRLAPDAHYLYMGLNPDAATSSLPTTRFVNAIKRRRGTIRHGPDTAEVASAVRPRATRRAALAARRTAATANQVAEEVYRQLVMWRHLRRGEVVVLDRDFAVDFAVSGGGRNADRPLKRLHTWIRTHLYRKPDLLVLLDAPAEVVFARKGEGTVEWLRERRQRYLDHVGAALTMTAVIDVDRPVDDVVADVEAAVDRARSQLRGRGRRAPA
jgi:thymidylate kinase